MISVKKSTNNKQQQHMHDMMEYVHFLKLYVEELHK